MTTTEEKAREAVGQVCSRIQKTIQVHDYEPSDELPTVMKDRYLPGFVTAIQENQKFWDDYGDKVLRMAGYVAAFACYFVERSASSLSTPREHVRVVGVREWLMAMGVVRSACLAGRDRPGVPCTRRNFPISDTARHATAHVLAEVIADLMKDAPTES
jgi:hypothetical protein